MSPEAYPGVDGAVNSWGTWAGGDSAAAGAASLGWDLRDTTAARAGLVLHPPAVVLFELASAGLVGAVLLVKLDTAWGFASAGAIKSVRWGGGRFRVCGCCWTAGNVGW